jgi:hypothetical protein
VGAPEPGRSGRDDVDRSTLDKVNEYLGGIGKTVGIATSVAAVVVALVLILILVL